jgi:acyl-CoA thioester hydrolase
VSKIKSEYALADFAVRTEDKLRRGDADPGGHVLNYNFPIFCETGRSQIFRDPEFVSLTTGFAPFVARFAIDYKAELFWPGTVEIGTGLKSIGRSSVLYLQGLFQNCKCAAVAETVMVQVDRITRRPAPMDARTKAWLSKFLLR